MNKIYLILPAIVFPFFVSCMSDKEIKDAKDSKIAYDIFEQSMGRIDSCFTGINLDSISDIYSRLKIPSERIVFARKLESYSVSLKDSIDKKKKEISYKRTEIGDNDFLKSKAGKIWKKHKEWSREDCQLLADGKIWIGMRYEMLKYRMGLPDHVNTSNYGNGNEYQWCWDEYNPSCFYGGENGIITSYN